MVDADAVRTSRAVTSLLVSVPDRTDLAVAARACNMESSLSPTRLLASHSRNALRASEVVPSAAGDHKKNKKKSSCQI